ncbi:MAG: hypothetical protein EB084_25500 [Proteobacteria bacterium]|nr:hypothetical protein [Pseudomonadota bacterium]
MRMRCGSMTRMRSRRRGRPASTCSSVCAEPRGICLESVDRLHASLVRMQGSLARAGIDAVVVGAVALAVWGEARYTLDVDFKISAERDDLHRLLAGLPPDCTPLGPADEMIERAGLLFVRDADGVRLDLLLCETSFDDEVLRRAVTVELGQGVSARVCTAEDLLIYKLIATREKDLIDATSLIRRQGATLDLAYVRRWLREFETALDDSTLIPTLERLLQRPAR